MNNKICIECFEIYTSKLPWDVCPKALCEGDVIEVDELMIPVIVKLNQKKYITEYCCAGHITEPINFIGSYIAFNEISFIGLMENNKMAPKYWYYDVESSSLRVSSILNNPSNFKESTMGKNLTKEFMKNYRNKFETINLLMQSLYIWSDKLK